MLVYLVMFQFFNGASPVVSPQPVPVITLIGVESAVTLRGVL